MLSLDVELINRENLVEFSLVINFIYYIRNHHYIISQFHYIICRFHSEIQFLCEVIRIKYFLITLWALIFYLVNVNAELASYRTIISILLIIVLIKSIEFTCRHSIRYFCYSLIYFWLILNHCEQLEIQCWVRFESVTSHLSFNYIIWVENE